ncbi:MAG: hypothetical protein FWC55_06600 [Firmicutes bacterium]|nr:hypothetical protein [Bacillota bacterium]
MPAVKIGWIRLSGGLKRHRAQTRKIFVGFCNSRDPQARLPARHVVPAAVAPIPAGNGENIFSKNQFVRQIDFVIITVRRSRPAVEPALGRNQLIIEPKPIFAVRRYFYGGKQTAVINELLSEINPVVRQYLIVYPNVHAVLLSVSVIITKFPNKCKDVTKL